MATPPPVDGEHAGVPFSSFMDELIRFDKPLFAAVNGVGVGIGLTLLLHCDFVMIANSARLRAPFVRLGVVPEAASSYLLEAVVGIRNAAEILFTAGWVSGARAVEIGLANSLHPVEEVLAAAEEKAKYTALIAQERCVTQSACCWRPGPRPWRRRGRARTRPSSSARVRPRTSRRSAPSSRSASPTSRACRRIEGAFRFARGGCRDRGRVRRAASAAARGLCYPSRRRWLCAEACRREDA